MCCFVGSRTFSKIADNLCNSKRETVERIIDITDKDVTFYEVDVTDEEAVNIIFKNRGYSFCRP